MIIWANIRRWDWKPAGQRRGLVVWEQRIVVLAVVVLTVKVVVRTGGSGPMVSKARKKCFRDGIQKGNRLVDGRRRAAEEAQEGWRLTEFLAGHEDIRVRL